MHSRSIDGRTSAPRTEAVVAYNRWLCGMRIWPVVAAFVVGLVLANIEVGTIRLGGVLAACLALLALSAAGRRAAATQRPQRFLLIQTIGDVAGITLFVASTAGGSEAMALRALYALPVVAASVVTVESGLVVAGAAAIGHLLLLALDRGVSVSAFIDVEAVVPAIALFLLPRLPALPRRLLMAQGETQLEELRQRMTADARLSSALVEVANVLSSVVETSELLARLHATSRAELGAEWSATFLVHPTEPTFRLVVDPGTEGAEGREPIQFPIGAWAPVQRLSREPVIVLGGADAERACALLAGGRSVSTVLVAGLRGDTGLAGFFALGCGTLDARVCEQAVRFLGAVARHATIVLHNAKLVEQVRLASALKSEFVGAISHELRSPLNVILGYIEMMLDEALGPVTGDQAGALRRTQEQALALLQMITALLDLNRLESGRLPLQRTVVAIDTLIGEICEQIPETWRRPEVALLRAVVPNLPAVETDPGKLTTVVRNLIHNAFKFTERGHVTVGAGRDPAGGVTITVSDTGRGIPSEAIGYVFEMFRQVPGAGGGGVGLGLHLVRRLVDALGGTVSVASEVGKGTCFTISLPAATARPSRAAA